MLHTVIFAFLVLSPAFLPAHAGQLFPSPNPAGNTIDTPADFGDPPVVTAQNDINYTNNGTVQLWGSFDNNGIFNNQRDPDRYRAIYQSQQQRQGLVHRAD